MTTRTVELDVIEGRDHDIHEHAAAAGVEVRYLGPANGAECVVYECVGEEQALIDWLERWCANASREAFDRGRGRYLVGSGG